jgi:flagellar transcriptional activator FlhC
LRALYRDLHGRSASSGQLPAIGCAVIANRRQQLLASLFATLYTTHAGADVNRQMRIDALVRAYDAFREISGESASGEFDFNLCWVIARDLRIGASRLVYCLDCGVRYLVMDNSRTPASCPLCALYARYGIRAATAGDMAASIAGAH